MVWHSPKSGREPFNRQMRKATRNVHAVSDALVNAKLFLALGDNTVWAEGLLGFYEIFKFLEAAMRRLKDSPLSAMFIDDLERTEAFEADLEFYLGQNWADAYEPRKEVVQYLQHLMTLEEEKPELLIAYIYHLYMGLLSGGQILRKKRTLTNYFSFFSENKGNSKAGHAVTDFGRSSIYSLKKHIVSTVNEVAMTLDDETKQAILEESSVVFQLNNKLISSLPSASAVLLRRLSKLILYCALLIVVIYILFFR